MQNTFDLSSQSAQLLAEIARSTGKSATEHLELALQGYFDDLADAEEALTRWNANEKRITSDEMSAYIEQLPE